MALHREIRNWIEAVINQRTYLMKNGLSKKNAHEMLTNIEFLKKRLDFFPYDSDRKISLLFQQNADKILSLLPGDGSGGFEKKQEEFTNYYNLTKSITNGENIHPGPNPGTRARV